MDMEGLPKFHWTNTKLDRTNRILVNSLIPIVNYLENLFWALEAIPRSNLLNISIWNDILKDFSGKTFATHTGLWVYVRLVLTKKMSQYPICIKTNWMADGDVMKNGSANVIRGRHPSPAYTVGSVKRFWKGSTHKQQSSFVSDEQEQQEQNHWSK